MQTKAIILALFATMALAVPTADKYDSKHVSKHQDKHDNVHVGKHQEYDNKHAGKHVQHDSYPRDYPGHHGGKWDGHNGNWDGHHGGGRPTHPGGPGFPGGPGGPGFPGGPGGPGGNNGGNPPVVANYEPCSGSDLLNATPACCSLGVGDLLDVECDNVPGFPTSPGNFRQLCGSKNPRCCTLPTGLLGINVACTDATGV